mmetsp:Transcript_11741/g.17821  ORF Transcript_11741/g.17821 Transcript_11741/m.17821 type:complete len:704 (+) Transcript_11741:189-2300(+)|eukprot:CAMPEP_0203685200 /NCGR_PEP_ID=MMETSP0090-20130426/48421_1 /ASSEMBLY_ACC=CAM_ASM_001088 /TAXON_ID=426623 /ORGANISM="Chaetoceros affinis, Strain CCMP159" /LENGTH=703 /DNA_ID=CAMNT_0050554387 /DNA_START=140 /DNA_END=2251 /DNA_ORIENTATION=-
MSVLNAKSSPHRRDKESSNTPSTIHHDNKKLRSPSFFRRSKTLPDYVIAFSLMLLAFALIKYSQLAGTGGAQETVGTKYRSTDTASAKETTITVTSSEHKKFYDETNNDPQSVLYFDSAALKNVRATQEGAHSWTKWASETILEVTVADKLDSFQVAPLTATVDRRPLTAKKQMVKDTQNLNDGGRLLGCAVTASTFVSKVENLYMKTMVNYFPVQCSVCFQFSNREDMAGFLPDLGFEPLPTSGGYDSTATKCFGGEATSSARFVKWQSKDSRFEGFGYPVTVDCQLPNGIRELTCNEISKMQDRMEETDELQSIYFRSKFTLDGYFGDPYVKTFHVFSKWPWSAVQSHDDDISKIARSLPSSWDDTSSKFVPSSVEELKLLHLEGPNYALGEWDGSLSLKSMKYHRESRGGVHFRFLVNIFHLVRNAPHSTHMIAVVDGQAVTTYNAMKELLGLRLDEIYRSYGEVFDNRSLKMDLIPIDTMRGMGNKYTKHVGLTLEGLLRARGVKLHIVPIVTPSISFEKSVCGGQYAFAAYVAARFAADYHLMMYVDGDTAMIEGSQRSLQEVLYERFFSKNSSKCAGHRLRLIEQYVKPEDDRTVRVLQCTEDIALNKEKWEYINEKCHLKEGHIVARSDSILAMSVHHPDTDIEYAPEGVEDCITPGNKRTDRYFLKTDEFIQLHLRNRLRKDECVCFADVNIESS